MYVKDLAAQASVSTHVVRYYTEIGLLTPERDPANGYRVYKPRDIHRLKFIRRARWLGFKLSDVRAILGDVDAGVSPCADVRDIVRVRLSDIGDKIEYLSRLQSRLERAQELWETMPDRPPNHRSLCHLIDAIAETSGG